MRSLVSALLALTVANALLPAHFESGRVFVEPLAANGTRLRLYTDTGGGTLLTRDAANRLGLKVSAPTAELAKELGDGAGMTDWPRFAPGQSLPEPQAGVVPVVASARELPGWPAQGDGILGAAWFGGHIWTWDYARGDLVLERRGWRPPSTARCVPLGFKTSSNGVRLTNFPRIDVTVAGRRIAMLLDTGAETYLTDAAMSRLRDNGSRMRATSMISASIFNTWRATHTDWPRIGHAQVGTQAAMIRASDVLIAGYHTGPVWFTWRSDWSYHGFMSSMMDRRVEGSIGGNALQSFRMTLDYLGARACFEQP